MWLSDFRIVLEDRVIERGSVRLQDGRIAEIAERPVPGAAREGDGLMLLPGFIDLHGDMIEREVEPRPNVRMPMELGLRDLDRRLKVAGVTTGFAAVSFHPGSAYGHMRSYDHTKAMLRALQEMRPALSVDHRVHARFEVTFPNALAVVEELIAEGIVDLVSLTDHTPGQGQYRDLERHIATVARNNGLTEDEARAEVRRRIAQKTEGAGDLAATLQRIASVCAGRGIAIASHDDDTPAKVALMQGLGASISEFPVTPEAAEAARARGMFTVMGAPNALRGESYSGNLSAREAHRQGRLDILAADYHPSAILPAVLVLAQADPDGIAGAARLATANPARAIGLQDRGRIAPGLRADLVIADPQGVGHVRATFCNGREVFADGTVRGRVAA
ncbi:alpha-D-ribose 1-methylphosphonate 5-triphosphate diphosphatase [Plastorhodobacter daqingensis]|uniref:Alpha-D-ribose 1-methylphosphonate 5-triphosphate diphosphatase n=1 Tax=Plastorhodobacter daqingensis TaxID=1387281 RepID=A0ABW2ULF4_9RHOB